MLSVAQADAAIRAAVRAAPAQRVPLRELPGAVLREAIHMERDQPPFDRVAMDGIAVNLGGITAGQPLRIVGTQPAGAAPLAVTQNDACIEVMTGAQLPQGCDAVIPVEQLTIDAGFAHLKGTLHLTPWQNVHRRGSDAKQADALLQPGTRLGPTEIAIIASAGYAQALACRRPRVAMLSTGDELVEPGQPINDWQIRRSNNYAVAAALQRHGYGIDTDEHVRDDAALLRERIALLLDTHDVLILSGGVSMGKFDHVPQTLTELGVQCVFHKVAQKPGKPLWFGTRSDGKAVYALPGNPVSTLFCTYRYVLPGLLVGMGGSPTAPALVPLGESIKTHAELTTFMPVKLDTDTAGTPRAWARPTRGSGDFISLLGADGFAEITAGGGVIDLGTPVPVYRW